MTTKEYLSQVVAYDDLINNKVYELERLRDLATSITVANGGDRVQTSSDKERMASTVAKIVDLENSIIDAIDHMVDTRNIIIKQIETMDSETYKILFCQFIENKNMGYFAKKNHYSRQGAYKKLNTAIVKFESKFGDDYLHK